MGRAGFVLVGGKSSRMGRDKALLELDGRTLAHRMAEVVAAAAGSVTLVGDPATYEHLGYPVIPDGLKQAGPLAGIHAALEFSGSDWNLILACDMPEVPLAFLRLLLDRAEAVQPIDCVIPESGPGRLEPLCAVYHRHCCAEIGRQLEQGTRKITDALGRLRMHTVSNVESRVFQNVNTPQDWDWYNSGMGIRR